MPVPRVTNSTIFSANTVADLDVFIPNGGFGTGSGVLICGGLFLTAPHLFTVERGKDVL